MVTIRANIYTARKDYKCIWCRRWIRKGEKYLRMFGMAEISDKPYEIMEHLKCIGVCDCQKVIEALKKAKIDFEYKDMEVTIHEVQTGKTELVST